MIGLAGNCTSRYVLQVFVIADRLPTDGAHISGPIWGRLIDANGPRLVLLAACGLLFSGYYGTKVIYDLGVPSGSATISATTTFILVLFKAMTGSGGNAGFTAGMNSTAKSFSASLVCRADVLVSLESHSCSNIACHYCRHCRLWLWTFRIALFHHCSSIPCGKYVFFSIPARLWYLHTTSAWHSVHQDRSSYSRNTDTTTH